MSPARPRPRDWLFALLASVAAALAMLPFHRQIAPANVALLLVLVVAWSAARLGRGPAALERLHYVQAAARSQVEVNAERLRNLMLTTLSHDLRTPLTVIYGLADTLRERLQDGDPGLRDMAAALCDEIMHLSRLGDSLLDLARLRSTPGLLRREWISVEELVGAALHGMRAVPGIRQVSTRIDPDLPWLRLDALMFERVLVNLVENAIKHGGQQQRILILADADATTVVLRVVNTGSRFAEDVSRLVAQASAVGESAAGVHAGLGLGICAAVIEAHGGRISLGNTDQGAEVRVELGLPRLSMPEPPDEAGAGEPS